MVRYAPDEWREERTERKGKEEERRLTKRTSEESTAERNDPYKKKMHLVQEVLHVV
ncbi:hypothetical protein [Prevotella veroralis]|uniref:hypothetical protein n=1 Tax=Prevotella veroralis TaxID=28137 RepID=UPI00031339AE|nr:hypothetical protein [Prevotella veroralis]QUB42251.1 hypothetical protein J5A55_12230 [Prevotella veroralis]